jgi:hypothetical protein
MSWAFVFWRLDGLDVQAGGGGMSWAFVFWRLDRLDVPDVGTSSLSRRGALTADPRNRLAR